MKNAKKPFALLLAVMMLLPMSLRAFALEDEPRTGQCGWTAELQAQTEEDPAQSAEDAPAAPEESDADTPQEAVVCDITPAEFEEYRAGYVKWATRVYLPDLEESGAFLAMGLFGPLLAGPTFFIPFAGPIAAGVLLIAPLFVPAVIVETLADALDKQLHKKEIAAGFTVKNLYAVPQEDGSFEIGFKYASSGLPDGAVPVAVAE